MFQGEKECLNSETAELKQKIRYLQDQLLPLSKQREYQEKEIQRLNRVSEEQRFDTLTLSYFSFLLKGLYEVLVQSLKHLLNFNRFVFKDSDMLKFEYTPQKMFDFQHNLVFDQHSHSSSHTVSQLIQTTGKMKC